MKKISYLSFEHFHLVMGFNWFALVFCEPVIKILKIGGDGNTVAITATVFDTRFRF